MTSRQTPSLRRRPHRALASIVAGALALLLAAGCGSTKPAASATAATTATTTTAAAATTATTTTAAAATTGTTTAPRYLDQVFARIATTSNLRYGSARNASGTRVALSLDLYQPAGDTVRRRPAIVWVHGGSFCCGDKTSGPSATLAEKFAHLGYVTVSIDYRLLERTACVVQPKTHTLTAACDAAALAAEHDAQAAVRWLRGHAAAYRVDPDRIGIGGDSAGAVTATLVGIDAGHSGASGNPGPSSAVRAFMSLSGGLPGGKLRSARVGAGDAAGLLFSGTADTTVPYAWSSQTTSDMLRDKVPAILVTFTGAGHDPYTQYESQIDTQSDYFFYTFMDMAHAQGSPAGAAASFAAQMRTIERRDPGYARAVALERARTR